MEMNEREIVTLVVFDKKDSLRKRQLKELILDMTRKDSSMRIDMQEVCDRLSRK